MNSKKPFKLNHLRISIGLSIIFIALYFLSPPFLELIELKTVDARFRGRGPIAQGGEVAIAVIDEKSMDELGRWPWPRTTIARLIDSLTAYGAKVIAFDVVFSEPFDNAELKALSAFKEKNKGVVQSAISDYIRTHGSELDQDFQLGKAVGDSGRVILGYFFHFDRDAMQREGLEISHTYSVESPKQGSEYNILTAKAIESNVETVSKGARGFGYYNIAPDDDGAVRWNPLVIKYKDKYYAPLSVEAIKAYLNAPSPSLSIAEYGVADIKIGDISIPVEESGKMFINYYGGQKTFPHYSVTDIINGKVEKDKLKDKIVLVGATAIGIYDMRVTPFEGVYPGVEIHATVIDNILNRRFIVRPQWFAMLDVIALAASGILLGLVFKRLDAVKGTVFTAVILAGYIYFGIYLFNYKGLIMNLTYPALTIVTTYSSLIFYKWTLESREKKKLKGTFQYYLAAPVMEELMKHPEKLRLGGEEKELTVLFSDIRKFTTISEGLKPDALIGLLNEYLSAMSEVVFKYQGYLDKYIGDAIMAVYGAPLMQPDHAKKACLTALEMMEGLAAIREQWKAAGLPLLDIGIGINTGNMVVGNVGSEQRFDYTVIGDNVNLASRMEGLNKIYGTNIIISETVFKAAPNEFICRELDIVQVRGKARAVKIYELIGKAEGGAGSGMAAAFNKGVTAYREKRWQDAVSAFEGVLKLRPDDTPSKLYIQSSRYYQANPPDENWRGSLKP